ncbi:hypothetical protein SEVIR_3G364950v4 [Setaria viridis]
MCCRDFMFFAVRVAGALMCKCQEKVRRRKQIRSSRQKGGRGEESHM